MEAVAVSWRVVMFECESETKTVDRRGFLKGSALFAAASALAVALPVAAQEPEKKPAPSEKEKSEDPKKDAPGKKELVDKNGRQYRVCDMCGGNMYKDGNTWTCEQCGYSYTE